MLKVLSKKKKKKSKVGLVVRKNVRKNIKWDSQTTAFWLKIVIDPSFWTHQKKKKKTVFGHMKDRVQIRFFVAGPLWDL